MATVSAADINKPAYSGECGNAGIFYGTYTGTPATGDVWRMCKIPAGIKVIEVKVINADLGTSAPTDFGYAHVDGTTGNSTAFASAQELGTAGTITSNKAAAPVTVAKEAYLTLTFGTINTGASGAVSVTVLGELFGAA